MNWTFNAALRYTSVASSTVLSSFSSVFTLLLRGVRQVQQMAVIGVLVVVLGATLVGVSDVTDDDGWGSLGGNVLALLSAFLYGVYAVSVETRLEGASATSEESENRVHMSTVYTCVGALTLCLSWPLPLLEGLLYHSDDTALTKAAVGMIAANAAISAFSGLLWAYAVVLTTSVLATVSRSVS
ncbi:MAG: hypothetical protein MHM6MM_009598, partial [Cercozoa sp. M6MM]